MLIDARGKSCPQPVILTKKALDEGESTLTILVDSEIPAQNVGRLLEKYGFSFSRKPGNPGIALEASQDSSAKTESPPSETPDMTTKGAEDSFVLVICRRILGGDDPHLGEVLIKGFLSTIAEKEHLPKTIILMNEGVYLAEKGSSTLESLEKMLARGVELLVCGTCTNHFGITEQIGGGTISNMFDITEAMLSAFRVISLP